MYRFSRSMYRELAPLVQENGVTPPEARRHVLDACEATMRRLAYDRRYFARPARSLFTDIRTHFPIHSQLYVYEVVNRHVKLALRHLEEMPDTIGLDGQPRQCRASTRKGTSCRRDPLPGRDYCPSHKHLEEDFGVFEGLAGPGGVGAAA